MQVPNTQKIRLVTEDDKLILEEDAVSLDLLMAQAQEDLDMHIKKDQRQFIINFADLLSQTYETQVSPTMAYLLSLSIESIGELLKKSISTLRNSSVSTEEPTEN